MRGLFGFQLSSIELASLTICGLLWKKLFASGFA